MQKKATIKDIARVAGVSATAVSMALNNSAEVSEKTRRRILTIARRLNYTPNTAARSLITRRSHTIGLIITTLQNPIYVEIAIGIEDKARELGYNVILCSTHYDPQREEAYIRMLRGKGVDGIIFCSVVVNDPNIPPLLQEGVPFLLAGRLLRSPRVEKHIDTIALDNVKAAYMVMDHLYRLGHRRVGIIAGTMNVSTAIERTDGVKKFLREKGLSLAPELMLNGKWNKEEAFKAAKQFLILKDRPTAIFAESDDMAMGVREALLDAGLRIPDDVALVGFDNIDITAIREVGLTTVSQQKYEMGALAVRMLVEKIDGRETGGVKHIVLEPELVIRNSCGYALRGYREEKEAKKKSISPN